MPRIDKLGATNRLQVSSPVPIGSSSAARAGGENIAQLGSDMSKAALTLNAFFKDAEVDDRRIKLDAIKQEAVARAQDAYLLAQTSGKQDGSDHVKLYDDAFSKTMNPIVDTIDDPQLRAEAANAATTARNSQRDNIVRGAMSAKVDSMSRMERAAFGQRMANTMANPYSVVDSIKENSANIDKLTALMPEGVREEQKIKDAQQLVVGSVESLMQKGKFNDARKLLLGDAAPYAGENLPKLMDRVQSEETQYKNRVLSDSAQATKQQEEAFKEKRETAFGTLWVQMAAAGADPTKKAEIRASAVEAVQNKTITVEQANAIERQGNEQALYGSGATKIGYLEKITNGSLKGITTQIIADGKAGNLSPSDTTQLLNQVNSARARANTKAADPKFKRDERLAVSMLKVQNGGIENQLGEIIVPGSKANIQLQMQSELYELMDQGVKPQEAAKRVIKRQFGEVAAAGFVPQQVLSVAEQGSLQSLKAAEERVKARYFQLKKSGKPEDIRLAEEVITKFNERKQALEWLEGNK